MPSVAGKLMRIAKDKRIANCSISDKLPRAWTTVYELTKLDDPTFRHARGGEHQPIDDQAGRRQRGVGREAPA
jgi:hypothetical protein